MISTMKRFFILLLSVLMLSACQKKNTFTVNGIVKEEKQKMIYLKRIIIDTPVLIDSSRISKSGRFGFRVKSDEPDFYQVGYSDAEFITLLAEPGEKITISFEGKNLFDHYNIAGSEGSEKVRMLDLRLAEGKRKLDSLIILYEKASAEPGFDIKGPELEKEYTDVLKDLRQKNIEFIITNLHSMASIKALYQRVDDDTYVLNETRDLQYMKIVADTLGKYYPRSKHVQALIRDLRNEMDQMYRNQFMQIASEIPETKLDPNLVDINGRRIALSSLRGKYVLLSFWSARSRECIADNLQLKEFYRKYRNSGFEIYQINLDENEDDWKSAVRFDELPWINTREDDPGNPVNARLFNVKSLPANYLFDKNGEIIGSNLRGRALQIKLEQLFNM